MIKVLVVEDDTKIARLLELELSHEKYDVRVVNNGYDALIEFEEYKPDIVILDVILPDIDGIEIAKRMRAKSDEVGIIMLTALGETEDKVAGLRSGADDYIVKPFDITELLARIEALIRRKGYKKEDVIEIDGLRIFPASRLVTIDGEEVNLSKTEFDLLLFLAKNRGVVLSNEKILDAVWGIDFYGNPNVVEVYINYLRRKLKHKGKYIKTIRGVGYTIRGEKN
ncbi:MAG TPA: response regulator transcription factor [Thermotoga sp.]|nr:response regulator transcription factor [Thermotoga sp.]